jgi:hypothetical protein
MRRAPAAAHAPASRHMLVAGAAHPRLATASRPSAGVAASCAPASEPPSLLFPLWPSTASQPTYPRRSRRLLRACTCAQSSASENRWHPCHTVLPPPAGEPLTLVCVPVPQCPLGKEETARRKLRCAFVRLAEKIEPLWAPSSLFSTRSVRSKIWNRFPLQGMAMWWIPLAILLYKFLCVATN